MALPNTGITVSLVRNTIGENKNDVGQLCTSNKINKWSFYKPITRNKLILTDADFYAVNDGFTAQSYNNAIDCWNAIINGSTWTHQTAEAPYRLGDFRGYDHNANPFLALTFWDAGQAKKGESRPIINNGTMDLQQIYNNFQFYSPIANQSGDNYCLGLLMNDKWTGSDNSVYFYRVCSILDFDGERIPFTVPSGLNSYDKTYKFVPVISSYMQSQNGSTTYFSANNPPQVSSFWYPFPSNVFQLYLKNETWTPTPAFGVTVEVPEVYFEYSSYQITDLTGSFRFTINQTVTYPINVSASIIYSNSSSPVTVANIGGTIAAGSTVYTCPWSYRDTIYTVADLKDPEEGLPFTVQYSYSYLGNTFNGTASCFAQYNDNPK